VEHDDFCGTARAQKEGCIDVVQQAGEVSPALMSRDRSAML
jgi:hypothetical protein